jgi:hypothetical protein
MRLMSVIDDYVSCLQKIELDYEIEKTGMAPRFQLPPDVGHSEAFEYALKYGVKHAIELQDALVQVGSVLQKDVHVLDIGCGAAMTENIVAAAGINVRSYSGIDHAPAQVWLARVVNPGRNFTTDLSVIPMIREPALVVMNHICAQENVDDSDMKNWAQDLHRIIPNGFDLLSIEPLMNIPKQDRLISFIGDEGHQSKVLMSVRTPGQFRYEKQTKVIRVSEFT